MQAAGNETQFLAPFITFIGGIAAHEIGRRLLFPKKENNGNGNLSARMELDMRDAVKAGINESVLPILNNQTQILQQVALATARTSEAVAALAAIERNRVI